jgi:single-strand DNA-binding protein
MFKSFGEGRLVADPIMKEVGETVVVSLTVAVNEYRKVNGQSVREPHFFDLKAWDSGGKTIMERAKKGDRLIFEARPRQERWEDKATGQKRSKVVFRIEEFTIINKVAIAEDVPDNEVVAN